MLVGKACALLPLGSIALRVGLASALNRGGPIDRALMGLALLGLSSPTFWLGLVFLYVFAYQLNWLPLGGHESWQHCVARICKPKSMVSPERFFA